MHIFHIVLNFHLLLVLLLFLLLFDLLIVEIVIYFFCICFEFFPRNYFLVLLILIHYALLHIFSNMILHLNILCLSLFFWFFQFSLLLLALFFCFHQYIYKFQEFFSLLVLLFQGHSLHLNLLTFQYNLFHQ